MRIVVPLRRVLDPAGVVAHRRLRRLFINREEYIIEPADEAALEAALRVKDDADAEIVVISGQPEPDKDTLRHGLAMGADRGIYLSGESFENADEAVAARALATALERLGGVDLVIAGMTTLDTDQGQLALRLAEILEWSQVVDAWSIEMSGRRLKAVRQDGDDYVRVETDLPAVVTVPAGAFRPRYPDGVRLVNAFRDEKGMAHTLERWDVVDLLTADECEPLLEDRGRDFPPERERGSRVDGPAEEVAQVLGEALRKRVGR